MTTKQGGRTNPMMSGVICDCGHDLVCHHVYGCGCGEPACNCNMSRVDVAEKQSDQMLKANAALQEKLKEARGLLKESYGCIFEGDAADYPETIDLTNRLAAFLKQEDA